jgi:hypothetical protein
LPILKYIKEIYPKAFQTKKIVKKVALTADFCVSQYMFFFCKERKVQKICLANHQKGTILYKETLWRGNKGILQYILSIVKKNI